MPEKGIKHKSHVENVALKEVPQELRQHWISVTFIQAGIMTCVPSLMLGGLLAQGLNFYDMIIAGVLGYAISTVIFTFQALQGHDLVWCITNNWRKLLPCLIKPKI